MFLVGQTVADVNGESSVRLAIPAVPALRGVEVQFEAFEWSALLQIANLGRAYGLEIV